MSRGRGGGEGELGEIKRRRRLARVEKEEEKMSWVR